MAHKTVRLRTAHYLDNVWHPAGAVVSIPEDHFDPALHDVPPADAAPAELPAPKPDDATSIAAESIPALLGTLSRRIDTLEQTTVSVLDFAKLQERVAAIETAFGPPAEPPTTPDEPKPPAEG